MTPPKWKFPPQIAGYMAQEPVQRELFTSEKQGSLARSLVREAVQNALDARKVDDQNLVVIRFALVEVPAEGYREYIEGLLPHLKAIDGNAVTIPDLTKPMQFLLIEDFNTKGLEGDPTISLPQRSNTRPGFLLFLA